jgi:hypothetical protein
MLVRPVNSIEMTIRMQAKALQRSILISIPVDEAD